MIFTRRFGALAARRTFPHIDVEQEQPAVDVTSAEAELEAMTADVEQESVLRRRQVMRFAVALRVLKRGCIQ